jgi:hypothetical protein
MIRVFIILLTFLSTAVLGQGERLTNLTSIPVKGDAMTYSMRSSSSLSLPFREDFSGDDFYPNPTRFEDNFVYISRDMPVDAPSYGAAVFDGLDPYGKAYDINSSSSQKADYLTSQPINLDFSASDSVYFSFFYQAAGLGNEPEFEDSLVLQFYRPSDTTWVSVWNAQGQSLSSFEEVLIPIIDTAFLKDGFRFRFYNYATLAGNLDHWLVDYIRLNTDRDANDTLIDDVMVARPMLSILNNYQLVPFRHFIASGSSLFKANQQLYFRNLSGTTRNVNFGYEIYQDGTNVFSSSVFFNNSNPVPVDSVTYNYQLGNISDNGNDSSVVEMRYYVKTQPDNNIDNDTIRYAHEFFQSYAYDDGTAERGYTLDATFGRAALKITPLIGDTLRALEIYFVPVLEDATNNEFRIGVWSDAGDRPGLLIHKTDTVTTPQYTHMNEFLRIELDTAIFIDGSVYIGYEQRFSSRMHVGFDRNIDNSDRLYYNTTGSWLQSELPGTLMIRPVFGSRVSSNVGVDENEVEVTIYPNPASEWITVEVSRKIDSYSIIDASGRMVDMGFLNHQNRIDVSSFVNGFYFLQLNFSDGQRTTEKLKIAR